MNYCIFYKDISIRINYRLSKIDRKIYKEYNSYQYNYPQVMLYRHCNTRLLRNTKVFYEIFKLESTIALETLT